MKAGKLFLAFGALGLAACQSTPPPQPPAPAVPKTPCQSAAELFTDPWITPIQQMAVLEVLRNRGCLGQAPTARVQIDQTIRVAPPQP